MNTRFQKIQESSGYQNLVCICTHMEADEETNHQFEVRKYSDGTKELVCTMCGDEMSLRINFGEE